MIWPKAMLLVSSSWS